MKTKLAGFSLLGALVYGPALFATLIVLHLDDFSFSTYAMCSLANGRQLYRLLFFITTWGMALLHLPFLIQWPSIAKHLGGNGKGSLIFYLAGIVYACGFFLFPVFPFDPLDMASYRIHQVIASCYFPACAVIALIPWINLRTGTGNRALYAVVSLLWMTASLLYFVPFVIFAKAAPPLSGMGQRGELDIPCHLRPLGPGVRDHPYQDEEYEERRGNRRKITVRCVKALINGSRFKPGIRITLRCPCPYSAIRRRTP